jgi:hypothetical protein
MVFETKNTDNWYGQQVFGGMYGYLAALGFLRTGNEQTFQYTGCLYHIRTGGNPDLKYKNSLLAE